VRAWCTVTVEPKRVPIVLKASDPFSPRCFVANVRCQTRPSCVPPLIKPPSGDYCTMGTATLLWDVQEKENARTKGFGRFAHSLRATWLGLIAQEAMRRPDIRGDVLIRDFLPKGGILRKSMDAKRGAASAWRPGKEEKA
jgi:hypothetical protein